MYTFGQKEYVFNTITPPYLQKKCCDASDIWLGNGTLSIYTDIITYLIICCVKKNDYKIVTKQYWHEIHSFDDQNNRLSTHLYVLLTPKVYINTRA